MKIKMRPYDIVLNILCIILLIGIVIYLIVRWGSIPEQVPGHFNLSGDVTRWDSKETLIVLPIIAWIIFIGFSILEQFPQIWNTGVRITQENMYHVFSILKTLLSTIKLLIVATFVSITVIQSLALGLSWWVLLYPILIIGTVIFNLVRLVKAR
ncbi:MAG: DUF1648 domain-containing protein [Oscillospiraceae bacterium]|nr:DUF1648 domain-containing protein [Oscillospiraceae bacterium]